MSSEKQAPVYTASAVAARLGVAVETLRTWDRRYGLGPGTRGPGGRRRYGEEDLARLLVMRRLVTSGMPTSEAARRAAGGGGDVPPVGITDGKPRSGGGRVVAIPRGTTLQHGLARAATALDVDEVERLLDEVIADVGVQRTWDGLLRPVLQAVGERWARTGEGVEVEHLLSQSTMDVFRRVADRSMPTSDAPSASQPVLLSSVDGDAHVLPLYVLAAVLAETGTRVRLLGASTPLPAMREAARRLRPSAIFLWAQLLGPMNDEFLHGVAEGRAGAHIVVGGPGWAQTHLPAGTRRSSALEDAVDLLAHA